MKEDRKDNSDKKEDQLPTASRLTPEEEAMFAGAPPKVKGYHIISTLGEGGFGIVYLAEQEKPVRRRVALKVLKPGMDSKRVIARFEAEEQALALLDHPNVAQVYEAGMTETGQSYFAMEFVKGVPITEYCDRNKLGIEDRLKVFVDVCDAIQHAHQKGIIHRDIKPSNILVYTEGEHVVPKVIDFGVAKAISQPLTERTLFTEQGQLIGTPEYMSPEQAEMAAQDIDTRTDIYSLGVLLYELLTGVLPFDPKTLREAGFAEIQRIIREQDPPRPSVRLSSLGEEAKEVAQSRRTKVAVLAKQLYKELEWIPLKAMRKERMYRYRSASEFADDIKNYLNGSPLIAGPESAVYRLKKFVRRNRTAVTATTIVAMAVLVGLVVSTTMYLRAEGLRVQAEQAREKEVSARAQAEQAEGIAQEQRRLAEERAEAHRRALYFNHFAMAKTAYLDGHMDTARERLEQCDAELRRWEWYRLRHLLYRFHTTHRRQEGVSEALNLIGHKECVWPIAFSPDGKRIVSGSDDKTIKVWDVTSGAELMTLRGHKDAVYYIAFSSDGKRFVSGSVDKTLKVWDLATGRELITLHGHDSQVQSTAFSPDGRRIVSGSADETIKVWDAETGAELMTLRGHKNNVYTVAFSLDGERIISGGSDGTVRVWDARTGGELMTLRGHESIVSRLSISPDGKHIISASTDGTVKVWGVETGVELMTLRGHEGMVFGIAFSPDGERILSGSGDCAVRVWDAATGTELMTLPGSSTVTTIEFSPDGRTVATSYEDGSIKLWETAAPAGGYGTRRTAEAARKAVDQLYEKFGFYHDVIDRLQVDKMLEQSVREMALQIANARQREDEDSEKLNRESWEVVSLSGGDAEAYQLALEKSEEANRLEPDNPSILNTLGIAQYRTGAYEDAFATLSRADKIHIDVYEEPNVASVAFIAMSLHQLGRTEETQDAIGRLRGLLEDGRLDDDQKAQDFFIEAEKLFAGGDMKLLSVWECIEGGKHEEAVQLVEELRSLPHQEGIEIAGGLEGAIRWLRRGFFIRAESRRIAGDYSGVIADYEAVVRVDPDHARALNELAWLRLICPEGEYRDGAKAVKEAGRACELTKWKNSSYLSTLAAAYSDVGDFVSAVKRQKEAIDLLSEDERFEWEANYQVQLKLYEAGKPYNQKGQLVSWWKFDDGRGTKAKDFSGNDYDGRLNNMDESNWVDGVAGGALKLDGVDDYVLIPALCLYSDTLTITAWIKRDGEQPESYTGIVYCRDGSTMAGISFGKGEDFGDINHELAYNWNENYSAWDWHSGLIVPDNKWVFVALVVEPTKATLYLGEDDTVSSATNRIKHHIEEFDGFVRIGSDPLTGSRYFKGLVDDVRIYSRNLSPEEVASLYTGKGAEPIKE